MRNTNSFMNGTHYTRLDIQQELRNELRQELEDQMKRQQQETPKIQTEEIVTEYNDFGVGCEDATFREMGDEPVERDSPVKKELQMKMNEVMRELGNDCKKEKNLIFLKILIMLTLRIKINF